MAKANNVHVVRTGDRALLDLMSPGSKASAPSPTTTRPLTQAEKSLIRKLHGHLPADQLLRILNERLQCDVGSSVAPYTMDQLYAEIGDAADAVLPGGHDWAGLRKLLAQAQKSGVLDSISTQLIDDFAVVFSLNAKQVLRLKDILLNNNEEDEA